MNGNYDVSIKAFSSISNRKKVIVKLCFFCHAVQLNIMESTRFDKKLTELCRT